MYLHPPCVRASRNDQDWQGYEGIGRPIAEIAALAGFREMPSFTRMFKRRYGATPGDVREAAGPGAVPRFES